MNNDGENAGLKIIILHPSELIRHALACLMQQCGYNVVQSFDTLEALSRHKAIKNADVVLMHHSLCESNGSIKQLIERTGVIVALLAASDSYHKDIFVDMMCILEEGVTGFLDMNEPPHIFFSELEDVASGDIVVSKNFTSNLFQKNVVIDQNIIEKLSQREITILDLVANGRTNKEIGQELFISEHTVKAIITSILTKLNLKNRQQAAAYLIRQQLVHGENTADNSKIA